MLERRAIPTIAAFLTRPSLHFNPGTIGYGSTTGWERGEKQLSALRDKKVRSRLCALIAEARAHDEAALECLKNV